MKADRTVQPERSRRPPDAARYLVLVFLTLAACRTTRPEPRTLPGAEDRTRRTTPVGTFTGAEGTANSDAWVGIPYAKPAEGALRWTAPTPFGTHDGVRRATQYGKPCTQYASLLIGIKDPDKDEVGGSEDCLTLNVYTPRDLPADSKLPVMFWIHGGGNSLGSAERYDAGRLAAKEKVVVVTVQYRLGPFGWFSHRGLRAGAPDERSKSGNFATLDLIEALRWVNQNIEAFGGNAKNVTVFGESAGAFNTMSLLMAKDAAGLFHRAIVQSGAPLRWSKAQAENWIDDAEPGHKNSSNEILARVLIARGAAKDRAEAKAKLTAMSDEQVGAWMRTLSPAELLGGYVDKRGFGMLDGAFVIADGAVLPDGDWLERFATADGWNRVPVILGTNRDEIKLFLFLDPKRIWKLFWVLPRYVDEPSYHAISTALSGAWKVAGVEGPATAMRRGGHADVYGYRWDWDEEPTILGANLSGMLGAAHGLEIPFVFGEFADSGFDVLFTDENRPGREALSDAMMSYWAQFADSGAPGRGRRGDAPEWSAWGEGQYVLLDTPQGGGIRMSSELQSWEKIAAYVRDAKELPDARHRCLLLHAAATWDHGRPKARYEQMGGDLCAPFPFERHPWGDPP